MTGIRNLGAALLAAAVVVVTPGPAAARSVGQVIDDTAITAQVKAKLVADTLSNLTRIEVTTQNAIVTLGGVVDDPERRARAAQIASSVGGVRGLVNNIHVAGTTVPPVASPAPGAPPVATMPPPSVPPAGAPVAPSTATAPGMSVDTTGVIAHVDRPSGTITLQDGRVVRVTEQTAVWQPITIDALRPGTRVYVREAAAVTVQTPGTALEWRMGTVRTVDRGTNQLVLTDGTIVRMPPGAVLRRGSERLTIDQIVPGSEVVLRTAPRTASAEGSALPGTVVSTTVDAAELNVVWTPVNGAR